MADDNEDGAEDERAVELSAIQAIFPELIIDPSNPFSASVDVPVEPIHPIRVRFLNPVDGAPPIGDLQDAVPPNTIQHLSYLPPLTLELSLPDGYPTQKPPELSLRSSWLPKRIVDDTIRAGINLWEEMGHEQIIYAYLDFLRESAEKVFDLASGEVLLEIPPELEAPLLDFNLKTKKDKFEQETFECGICLEPKKGLVCHRLDLCSHVFCVECLSDFYKNCIIEGDVGRVMCTAPGCGDEDTNTVTGIFTKKTRKKKDRTLEPSELLQIPLDQETVQRYITLRRKKRLESNRRTIYCPRQWCQGPARSQKNKFQSTETEESDSEAEAEDEPQSYDPNEPEKLPPPAERLAICEDCNFAFCKVCKASWHGEYFVCFPRSQFELTEEERASEDYLKIHTQPCPTCDARAQKTHGCNHMICFKCDTHFCYLCGTYLTRENPYTHFNTPNQGCYMRLWELEAGDGADVGQRFEGGVVHVAEAEEVRVAPVHHAVNGIREQPHVNADAGLQRFLHLALNDEEDEWDSSEDEWDTDDDEPFDDDPFR